MSKESNYTITFEFLESQMFGAGLEHKELSDIFLNPEYDRSTLEKALVVYSKRLRWFGTIIESLNDIHQEVSKISKSIIELLYFKNESFDCVIKELNISKKRLIRQHSLMVDEMMDSLGMKFESKTKKKKSGRYIPTSVKLKVFEAENGKCSHCRSEDKLHYHHVNKFSNGGTNSCYNLTLLCAYCHSQVHKGEREYNLLKANVENS